MKNINENEMIDINGGGMATHLFNNTINTLEHISVSRIDITHLKETTLRNLTNKLANSNYVSTVSTVKIDDRYTVKYLVTSKRN